MDALGMLEVYSFTEAVCAADAAAKAANIQVIAFDRNRPVREDVPAPLVMEVKVTGRVSAVRAAVDAAEQHARQQGKFLVSHVIANPAGGIEGMAYLLDINRDRYNKTLPKSFFQMPPAAQHAGSAIGLLEVQGLVASIEGLDTMVKTAAVRLIHTEKRLGGRLVTLVITGSVSAVGAAVAAGKDAACALGKVYGHAVIANPHAEICKFFDFD